MAIDGLINRSSLYCYILKNNCFVCCLILMVIIMFEYLLLIKQKIHLTEYYKASNFIVNINHLFGCVEKPYLLCNTKYFG